MISLLASTFHTRSSTRKASRAVRRSIPDPSGILVLLLALVAIARPLPASAALLQGDPSVGSITGTVAEENLQPVAGAVVQLVGTDRSAVTNPAGRFRLEEVPMGAYEISVTALGHTEARRSGIEVRSGNTTEVALRMRTAPILLERIQVTATKNPASIGAVPALVSIVDEEQIAREGDLELTQAIDNVPGLINSTLLHSFESVLLRGMPRTGNEWTTTLLLIDGVPQTDSRNSARVINLPINDVNRVEVVRGPNSALYGRTALGGVVNVLTTAPTLEPQAHFEVQGGQFGHLKGRASASGPIQSWGGYYISGASGRNRGFYRQDFPFDVEENALYAKFTFTPDSKSHGMVSVNNVVSDNAVPTPVPVIDGVLLSDLDRRFDRYRNLNLPTANYHQEELRTTFNYHRKLADWISFTEILGYRDIQYKFENDGDVIGGPFDLGAKTFTMYPFELQTDEEILYQEARLGIQPGLGRIDNSLLVGLSYERTTGFGAGNLIYTDEETLGWPISYLNPTIPDRSEWKFFRFGGNDYHLGILGIYTQYAISPVSRLTLTLGGRYDRAKLRNVQTFAKDRPRIEDEFAAFSPKVSATLRVFDQATRALGSLKLNAYASYSEAFLPPRTPGSLRPADAKAKLVPEDVRNYEAGFKGSLADGRLSYDGALFRMQRDGIVVSTREGPLFRPSNAGVQNFRGFEGSVGWTPIENLSLYANGAFYQHRFGRFMIQRKSGDVVLTGNRLPISPDLIYNAGASWRHSSGVGATLNVKHVSDRFLDQRNTFLLEPYTVADASLSWRRGPARLTLGVHNLFNEKYFTMGDISNGESADPAPPRQIVLISSFQFR
jgi:iron complex outermembrane receptor protein